MDLFSHDFYILYRVRNGDYVFENKNLLKDFKKIKCPFAHWCADPFVINVSNKEYVFAEVANNFTRKGKIAYFCLNSGEKKWKNSFKPKFHISFPNVFLLNDHLYAMPETNNDKCVALYQINDFSSWKKIETLFESNFSVDSSFVDLRGLDDFLFLSYDSDFEFGEKRLSLRNKTNPALALSSITDQYNVLRPAGNVFTLKNEKILPTQDCSKYYGGAIIFNSINTDNGLSVIEKFRLTPEDIVREIGIKNCIGCHTYNFNDKIEVIDVVIRHFSFGGLFYKIKSKFSKLFKNRK